MATLHELQNNYIILLDMLLDDDSDDDVINDTLEAVQGEIEVKLENYKIIDSELEAEEDKFTKEIERLSNIKARIIKNRAKLKERMTDAVSMMPEQICKSEHYTFKMVTNGGKMPLIIADGVDIPDDFCKFIKEIDKDKIRKSLDDGVALDFAKYGERGKHISIK